MDDKYSPVIGIFAQPSEDMEPYFNASEGYSYIPASYVKWMESAGARVVPIPYNIQTVQDMNFIFNRINGLLMPGGDASLWVNETTHTGFSNQTKFGQMILKRAMEYNDAGNTFPIWGTCMSYEMMLLIVTGNDKILDNFDSKDHHLNTTIIKNVTSDLYNSIPQEYIPKIENSETFYYNHRYGLTPEHFYSNKNLTDMFHLTGTSYYKNQTFVASLEAKNYPFILTQYHPEKNAFEWTDIVDANHNDYAIASAQFQANYFVNLARKSHNRFDNYDQYFSYSILNYPALNTARLRNANYWVQVYVLQAANNTNIPEEQLNQQISETINQQQ